MSPGFSGWERHVARFASADHLDLVRRSRDEEGTGTPRREQVCANPKGPRIDPSKSTHPLCLRGRQFILRRLQTAPCCATISRGLSEYAIDLSLERTHGGLGICPVSNGKQTEIRSNLHRNAPLNKCQRDLRRSPVWITSKLMLIPLPYCR